MLYFLTEIGKQVAQLSRPKNASTPQQNKGKQKPSKVEENLKKLLMFSSSVNLDEESTQKVDSKLVILETIKPFSFAAVQTSTDTKICHSGTEIKRTSRNRLYG